MTTRPLLPALKRGTFGRCPNCGEGRLFQKFLGVNDVCAHCGEELHHHRADDAPPYIVMFIVAHVVVGLMLMIEIAYEPAMWIYAVVFMPMTLILSLALLPPVKGGLIAFQWAKRMHGFDPTNPVY